MLLATAAVGIEFTRGSGRRVMFPETRRDIPFTIENHVLVDHFGRETVDPPEPRQELVRSHGWPARATRGADALGAPQRDERSAPSAPVSALSWSRRAGRLPSAGRTEST
jgi:hypothetical protein